jgi:fatty-acyl-CoA synthase
MADPLYLIFTSGTTGLPKAAKMSHLRFINSGEMVGGLMEFGAEDVFYCVLPLYHGAGAWWCARLR